MKRKQLDSKEKAAAEIPLFSVLVTAICEMPQSEKSNRDFVGVPAKND